MSNLEATIADTRVSFPPFKTFPISSWSKVMGFQLCKSKLLTAILDPNFFQMIPDEFVCFQLGIYGELSGIIFQGKYCLQIRHLQAPSRRFRQLCVWIEPINFPPSGTRLLANTFHVDSMETLQDNLAPCYLGPLAALHCIASHHITSHHITIHSTTLHYTTLHYITYIH